MAMTADVRLIVDSWNATWDATTAPKAHEEHYQYKYPSDCTDLLFNDRRARLSTSVASYNAGFPRPKLWIALLIGITWHIEDEILSPWR